MTELTAMTAAELAEAIASGRTSSVEVTRAHLDRIADVDERTGAFLHVSGEVALERARSAAGERNVSVAGGASTVNQFLAAGLLDELRLHVTASILGAGERIFAGVPPQALERVSVRATPLVTHMTYRPVRD